MGTQLENLRQHSVVVADSGDFAAIGEFATRDATTNPSLILAAAKLPQYRELVRQAIVAASRGKKPSAAEVCEQLSVDFGLQLLKVVAGRVSTEVSANHSFSREDTIASAMRIIEQYQAQGIDKQRILIKIAATWEGIAAAKVLEREGICCNLTLLFSMPQAVACADAGVTLISPFVGRITDWFKKLENVTDYPIERDPGVQSVVNIYQYYKKFAYNTEVMAASFRSTAQILALAGCDLLTIAPKFLQELSATEGEVEATLRPDMAATEHITAMHELTEATFRWQLNTNAMATEKLAEGIRLFAEDQHRLEHFIATMI